MGRDEAIVEPRVRRVPRCEAPGFVVTRSAHTVSSRFRLAGDSIKPRAATFVARWPGPRVGLSAPEPPQAAGVARRLSNIARLASSCARLAPPSSRLALISLSERHPDPPSGAPRRFPTKQQASPDIDLRSGGTCGPTRGARLVSSRRPGASWIARRDTTDAIQRQGASVLASQGGKGRLRTVTSSSQSANRCLVPGPRRA